LGVICFRFIAFPSFAQEINPTPNLLQKQLWKIIPNQHIFSKLVGEGFRNVILDFYAYLSVTTKKAINWKKQQGIDS